MWLTDGGGEWGEGAWELEDGLVLVTSLLTAYGTFNRRFAGRVVNANQPMSFEIRSLRTVIGETKEFLCRVSICHVDRLECFTSKRYDCDFETSKRTILCDFFTSKPLVRRGFANNSCSNFCSTCLLASDFSRQRSPPCRPGVVY